MDNAINFTPRAEFQRNSLIGEIGQMLSDLGNPPLVERAFPNGWRNASYEKLTQLYDLCGRTYAARERQSHGG